MPAEPARRGRRPREGRSSGRRAIAAAWVAVAGLGAGAVAGCGSGGGADGYGPELRADFVQACAPGADEASCGCFYDRLAAEVPYERFEELDAQLVDDPTSLPDDIVDLAVACSAPEVADADASG